MWWQTGGKTMQVADFYRLVRMLYQVAAKSTPGNCYPRDSTRLLRVRGMYGMHILGGDNLPRNYLEFVTNKKCA